jgi:hypothetical protein
MRTDRNIRGSSGLSSDERRRAIIESVKEVFAENGFDGATTRELAKAAGILIEQAVEFALRGVGLKDDTIKRYYHAKSLRLLAE